MDVLGGDDGACRAGRVCGNGDDGGEFAGSGSLVDESLVEAASSACEYEVIRGWVCATSASTHKVARGRLG